MTFGFEFVSGPVLETFISRIELAVSMGSDKAVSGVYVSALITIAFQLLFPGNRGAVRLAIPPEAIVSAASIVEYVT